MADDSSLLLAEVMRALEAAQSQIEVLQGQVALLIARQALGGTVVGQEQGAPDRDFTAWVTWLLDTYQLEEAVPSCWDQHSPVQEELQALRVAHAGATDDLQARPSDLLAWHEALQRSLSRVREWDRDKCRSHGHPSGISD